MRLAALFLFAILMASCTPSGVLKAVVGGGPNVAANVQAGKTNTQTIGQTQISERKTTQKLIRPKARSIVQSHEETETRIEAAGTVVTNEGWGFWPVIGALLFPSPLGLIWWPLIKRLQRRSEDYLRPRS